MRTTSGGSKKLIATHHSSLLTILLLPTSPIALPRPNLHHHHRESYAHAHVRYAHSKTITNITTTINKNQTSTNITTAMRARIDGTPPAWSDRNIPLPLKLHPSRYQKRRFKISNTINGISVLLCACTPLSGAALFVHLTLACDYTLL